MGKLLNATLGRVRGQFQSTVAQGSTPGRIYQAGTLQYTTGGLTRLFVWLLWGDFFYNTFEYAMPQLLPLCLKDFHASNSLIGVVMGSISGVLNLLVVPWMSVWTDRYRSRRGRRIPFLLWSSPGTAACLILIGYAGPLGSRLHGLLGPYAAGVSAMGLSLAVTCVLVSLYHFFNIFVCSIYNALVRDVVPMEVMSRFISLFRVVETLAIFVFSRYIFGHAKAHRQEIFLAIGIIYLFAFLLMCRRVKEGEYPPPPPYERPGFWMPIRTYCRDCFTAPIYIFFFAMIVCLALGACVMPFRIFFLQDTVGLSLDQIGKIVAWGSLATAGLLLPAGYLTDKIHPLRSFMIATVVGFLLTSLSYPFLRDHRSALIFTLLIAPVAALGAVSQMSMTMLLFPKGKFAQFSSVLGMLSCVSAIGGNWVAGRFVDWTHNDYRMILVWTATFSGLSLIPMVLLYREWKRLGGSHYIPPVASSSGSLETTLDRLGGEA